MAKLKTTRTPDGHLKPAKPLLLKSFAASPDNAPQASLSDELIRSLANSYENKRARQVGEWENIQAKAKYRLG